MLGKFELQVMLLLLGPAADEVLASVGLLASVELPSVVSIICTALYILAIP